MKHYCFIDFETTGLDCKRDLPIEVAAVLTDGHFDELNYYSALIAWPDLTDGSAWRPQYQKAADVHRITPQEYERDGKRPDEVVAELIALCPADSKIILVSDNIHFDYGFMEVLFHRVSKALPFHYLGFDTGLMFDVCRVDDPVSEHRALPDVKLILSAVRKCVVAHRGR